MAREGAEEKIVARLLIRVVAQSGLGVLVDIRPDKVATTGKVGKTQKRKGRECNALGENGEAVGVFDFPGVFSNFFFFFSFWLCRFCC